MKVVFSKTKKEAFKPKKPNLSFGKGLTPKFANEIKTADIIGISEKFAQKGIQVYFDGDKSLAWLCQKTTEIFEQIRAYEPNLQGPSGIFGINFKKLNLKKPNAYGFCNLTPSRLIKGSKENIPSRIIFFNTEYDWSKIDLIAETNYASGASSTDFFLYPILHEYAHVAHENNLLEMFEEKTVLKKILSATNTQNIKKYQKKYGDKISQICKYALSDPIEAVGCDMPVKIINSLDMEKLTPNRNPFIGTPYKKIVFDKKYSDSKPPLQEILKRFWNGDFD